MIFMICGMYVDINLLLSQPFITLYHLTKYSNTLVCIDILQQREVGKYKMCGNYFSDRRLDHYDLYLIADRFEMQTMIKLYTTIFKKFNCHIDLSYR